MFRLVSSALAALATAAMLAITSAPASAQTSTWPTRPVRFIVPLGPGSGVDISARMLADKFTAKWGQPVVVENRPGGDGFIAITAVTGGNDDHVLLFAPTSTFTAHPLQHAKLPYDIKDLVPAARITNTVIGMAVPASLGVKTLKEFVDKVRAEPGKLNYASATGANDLLFSAFLKTENLNMSRVPYRDTVQAVNDLAEGRVHAYVAAYAILRPRVQAGKIKILSLTNSKPVPQLPDIPTSTQAGFKFLTMDGLTGILGPTSLSQAARDRIATDVREAVEDPAIKERLIATGQVINPGNGKEFAADIDEQFAIVKTVGNTLGMTPPQ